MAGMLPPFVPPSARVPAQPLPLITEFVVDRGEWATSAASVTTASAATGPWKAQANGTSHELMLPSIDEFLMRAPVIAHSEAEPADSHDPSADPSAAVPEASAASVHESAPETQPEQPDEQPEEQQQPEAAADERQSSGPMQQEAEPGASEQSHAHSDQEPAIDEVAQTEPSGDLADSNRPASQTSSEAWIREERDSFNWQSAANLAAGPEDERRASEEWSSTDWDPRAGGSQEHVVALLAQVARRVRSGELQVNGARVVTAEAALAAVLAALLAEPDGQ